MAWLGLLIFKQQTLTNKFDMTTDTMHSWLLSCALWKGSLRISIERLPLFATHWACFLTSTRNGLSPLIDRRMSLYDTIRHTRHTVKSKHRDENSTIRTSDNRVYLLVPCFGYSLFSLLFLFAMFSSLPRQKQVKRNQHRSYRVRGKSFYHLSFSWLCLQRVSRNFNYYFFFKAIGIRISLHVLLCYIAKCSIQCIVYWCFTTYVGSRRDRG